MEDKVLFTPGPLSTSLEVKKSGLRDLGSRDKEFIPSLADALNMGTNSKRHL